MLLRVINVLAQRDLLPEALEARVHGHTMLIRIEALTPPFVESLLAKLRSLIEIETATMDLLDDPQGRDVHPTV